MQAMRVLVASALLPGKLAFQDGAWPRGGGLLRRHRPFMTATVDFVDAATLEEEAFKDVEDEEDGAPAVVSRAQEWFDAALGDADGSAACESVTGARAAGRAALTSTALPIKKQEAWRFTNLESLWKTGAAATGLESSGVTAEALAPWLPAAESGEAVVVVVDGVVDEALSARCGYDDGEATWCGSIAHAPEAVLGDVGAAFEALPEVDLELSLPARNALGAGCWCALNAACAADGVVVWARADPAAAAAAAARDEEGNKIEVDGATDARRVHVVHVRSAAAGALHPRCVVHLGDGARVAVRESFVRLGGPAVAPRAALTNARTNMNIGAGGRLTHVIDSQEVDQVHIHHAQATVAADATFVSRTISDGAKTARIAVEADVVGEGGLFDFLGLQLGASDQNLDLRTALRHTASDAESVQDIRNVAGEKAKLTFKGRINVPVTGQRTNADQICKSLLLDDGATVDTMPSLEIIADDVKCTHGATIADLDEEGLFYLNSRGLSEKDARKLLIKAFCYELVQKTDLVSAATLDRLDAKLADLTE